MFVEKIGDIVLEDNEHIIGHYGDYTITEIKEADGWATYVIYDNWGNYIDEFWGDEPLKPEEKENDEAFQASAIGKDAIKRITEFEDDMEYVNIDGHHPAGFSHDDWDDSYLTDPHFMSMAWKGLPAPKQKSPEEREKEEAELLESLCKSDTIVFHLEDKSTKMLEPIYEGRGWDVYRGSGWGMSHDFFIKLIERHDKILCLGHGTPSGLIGGCFGPIEAEAVKAQGKKIFALWCYAATFFKKNGFEGYGVFCSDNCPSEVWECRAACHADVSAEWILNNMYYLSDCIKDVIDICWDNPEEACKRAREKYAKAEATTEDEKKVVEFNTNTLQVV